MNPPCLVGERQVGFHFTWQLNEAEADVNSTDVPHLPEESPGIGTQNKEYHMYT